MNLLMMDLIAERVVVMVGDNLVLSNSDWGFEEGRTAAAADAVICQLVVSISNYRCLPPTLLKSPQIFRSVHHSIAANELR
jgi:hypothetical protein